jgi:hypothetical protein
MKSPLVVLFALLLLQEKKSAITDPAKGGTEYSIQGEYLNAAAGWGAQVIALGDDKFEAFLLRGGLPGAGWDGKTRLKASGQNHGPSVALEGDWQGVISNGALKISFPKEKLSFEIEKTVRKSPTEGAKPPPGAIVLFNGESGAEFSAGGKDAKVVDGLIWTNGTGGFFSRKKFGSVKLHIEFMLSFMPFARGQGRSNSGVYLAGRHECQVLDSFGLTGENNECGGIYTIAKPEVNMCFPPLSWQTYDIEYRIAAPDKPATISVIHNGVKIHENVELKKHTTAAPDNGADDTPGPLHLQDHGNPVAYRNIWMVELK